MDLKRIVTFEGFGLHSNQQAEIAVSVKEPGHGLIFRRTDLAGSPQIRVSPNVVFSASYHTVLKKDGVSVSTVEHLLAALSGLGIWDAQIDVNGPEIPILDGSALKFVEKLVELGCPDRPEAIEIKEPLSIEEGESRAKILPRSDEFELRSTIDFDHPAIGVQQAFWNGSRESFIQEIAPARTFGFLSEIEKLYSKGLAAGGSLENAVVFDDNAPINPLRFENEPARHKLLDSVGDFALLGRPLRASIELHRPGHAFIVRVVKKIWEGI